MQITAVGRTGWAPTVVCFLFALALSGCKKPVQSGVTRDNPEGLERLQLRYQANPGVVSPPELAEDLGYLAPIKLDCVGSTASGPTSIQAVVTGDTDFGSAFNGAVVKLVAAKAPIVAVLGSYGVDQATWGGFYVKEDSPIKSARDLIGKKVSVNTLGAHSEFMLKEYLFRKGLNKAEAEQVTMVVLPPVNGEQALRQGQVEVATLGTVFRDRALERGGIRLLFSDYQLYGEFTAGSYVLRNDFIEANPKTARKFVTAVAKAIDWERSTPREEVVRRFESIIAKRKRTEDTQVIKYWLSSGIAGHSGLLTSKDFQIWLDWMVKDGQLSAGQVRANDVFSNALNAFAN
jgi:ABC-type nitrate/sulfonate/bicarbonate transport system substrate-binding protein